LFDEEDVQEEWMEEAEEWRGKLVEALAEVMIPFSKDMLRITNQSHLKRS